MHEVNIDVTFAKLEDAELFHDAIREFIDEYAKQMGVVLAYDSSVGDIDEPK